MTQFVLKSESLSTEEQEAKREKVGELLSGLNPMQRGAAEHTDGPLLIIAGPGSGKTRTLTHRIAYLLATGRAKPWTILAITFTNKAAREMRERVVELVGTETARGMWIGTFHSTFARLLRRECSALGYSPDFSIYDTDDSQRIIRELEVAHDIDPKQYRPRALQGMISSARNRMVGPSQYEVMATTPQQERAARIYRPYLDRLRQANAMDFDDLLLKPIELFENNPDVLEKYRGRWQFIHVDEYQDTNKAQYTLARQLADGHHNICVVGDDAQSIYAFRGADISNILSFQKDYPEAETVRLEQNYRSTGRIVRLADSIIRNNRDQLEKKLWTENDEGDPVIVVEALSERDEAQKIERRIRDIQLRMGLLYSDFAVLYRTNAQSRSLEDALRRGGIPYRVVGGQSFYQRREIKDALAYLRLVVNPNDIASLRRVINNPTRGIGDKTQQRLFAFAAEQNMSLWDALEKVDQSGLPARATSAVSKFRDLIDSYRVAAAQDPPSELARSLIRDSGLLEAFRREHTPENLMRWENVQELLNAISEYDAIPEQDANSEAPAPSTEVGDGQNELDLTANARTRTLGGFLQDISLLTDADEKDYTENRVTLMTLHASKGLEFPVVFVSGLEEGLFPLAAATQDRIELEEERRLFYVGTTRAQQLLLLSYARSRFRYGEQQTAIRSRFLEELDASVMRTEAGQPFEPRKERFTIRTGGVKGSGESAGNRSGSVEFGRKKSGSGVSISRKDGMGPATADTVGHRVVEITHDVSYGELDPHYYRKNLRATGAEPAGSGRRVVYDEEESRRIVPGMRVEHKLFGEGKVLALDGKGDTAKATVFFREVGQKKLILKFAHLKRIDG